MLNTLIIYYLAYKNKNDKKDRKATNNTKRNKYRWDIFNRYV